MSPNLSKKVNKMKQEGVPQGKIVENLKGDGHSSKDIYNTMSNSEGYSDSSLEAPAPSSQEMGNPTEEKHPQEMPQGNEGEMYANEEPSTASIPSRQQIEDIEEVAEAIVDEKWQELSSMMSNLNMWKERVSSEIDAIKQELLRVRNHQENLQNTVIGRVEGYNKNIQNISAEMKALERVFSKIMEPLTNNIKDLSRITDVLRKVPRR